MERLAKKMRSLLYASLAALAFLAAHPCAPGPGCLSGAAENQGTQAGPAVEYMKAIEILDRLNAFGSDDVTFIRGVYRILLNRVPSGREMTLWVKRLSSGAVRLNLIEALTASDEYYLKHDVYGYVSAKSVRIMQAADEEATCVTKMAKDSKFKVVAQSAALRRGGDAWYHVRFDSGVTGYVPASYVSIPLPVFKLVEADRPAAGDTGEAALSAFARTFASEIATTSEYCAKLDSCLIKDGKIRPYELIPGKLIDGEKNLTRFRVSLLDLVNKASVYNSKNPLAYRIARFEFDAKSVASYEAMKKLNELVYANYGAVAVDAFTGGRCIVPCQGFEPLDADGSHKAALEWLKEETDYRKMKRYALVDALNFGPAFFARKKELFMKNGFGEYSNAAEQGRYFPDFTNPEVGSLIFGCIDAIIKSGYFDGIIVDNLRFPRHPKSNGDIRAIFAFNEAVVKEFETNTKLQIGAMNEAQEAFFKKFASRKLEDFVAELRKFISERKKQFLAVCDSDYYDSKFDTRLCDFVSWGNNLDVIFLRIPGADAAGDVKKALDISKKISKTAVITLKTVEIGKIQDAVREINEKSPVIKGVYCENR